MEDNLVQVFARLTAHEFFLEVAYANWFATMSEPHAQQMIRDLSQRMRKAYVAQDAQQDAAQESGLQVATDAAAMADRFLEKVATRTAEIRAKLAQGQGG